MCPLVTFLFFGTLYLAQNNCIGPGMHADANTFCEVASVICKLLYTCLLVQYFNNLVVLLGGCVDGVDHFILL